MISRPRTGEYDDCMTRRIGINITAAVSTSLCLVAAMMVPLACMTPAPKTVPGPESDKLVPTASGYVVFERPHGGGIAAVELPSLRETTVVPDPPKDARDRPNIHALSGPDEQGRIAYIENHFDVPKDRRHSLKTIWVDGTHEATLFTRSGDAMWATTAIGHGEIGKSIALSPVGGHVAFLSGTSSVQMPSALLTVGNVEMWDVEKKTGIKTETKAVDDGLAWFPDGRRLAYVKLVDAKTVSLPANDPFGQGYSGWNQIPAVFVRDVDAKTESFLHVGRLPVISANGMKVLVYDAYGHYELVDVATGNAVAVDPQGQVYAFLDDELVLTLTLPTAGSQVRYTDSYSPLAGPKELLSLKLFSLNDGRFQTVVPNFDRRLQVSFGRVKSK